MARGLLFPYRQRPLRHTAPAGQTDFLISLRAVQPPQILYCQHLGVF